MIGTDPADDYDDDAPLTDRSLERLEFMLKEEIAENIVWAQYNRAKGDKPNGYAVRNIKDRSRQLRTILRMHDADESRSRVWDKRLTDDVYGKLEFEGRLTLREIVEQMHENGSKPEVKADGE